MLPSGGHNDELQFATGADCSLIFPVVTRSVLVAKDVTVNVPVQNCERGPVSKVRFPDICLFKNDLFINIRRKFIPYCLC